MVVLLFVCLFIYLFFYVTKENTELKHNANVFVNSALNSVVSLFKQRSNLVFFLGVVH